MSMHVYMWTIPQATVWERTSELTLNFLSFTQTKHHLFAQCPPTHLSTTCPSPMSEASSCFPCHWPAPSQGSLHWLAAWCTNLDGPWPTWPVPGDESASSCQQYPDPLQAKGLDWRRIIIIVTPGNRETWPVTQQYTCPLPWNRLMMVSCTFSLLICHCAAGTCTLRSAA